MKKKLILIGVAAILVMTELIGGSLAYFQADGREVRQQLGTRRLGISLMGDTEGPERLQDGNLRFDTVMPGAEIKKEIFVENTGVGLDIEADAVQTVAAKDAILSEWGVLATIDGNGVITAVEE